MPLLVRFLSGSFLLLLIFSAGLVYAGTKSPSEIPCEQETPELPLSELIPRCLSERKTSRTPEEMIANDVEACRCIKNHVLLKELAPDSTGPEDGSTNNKLEDFNIAFANNRAITVITSISNSRNVEIGLMTGTGQEARKRLTKEVNSGSLRELMSQLNPDERAVLLKGPSIGGGLSTVNQIPEELKNSHCVTYIEYSAHKAFPSDNSFFSFLQQTNAYRDEDWNIDSLRVKYDRSSNAGEREGIYARMQFLSRNQQFSALFRASSTAAFPETVINRKKAEFFGILRSLAPAQNSTCSTEPNGCWREAQISGANQRFSEAAEAFLQNNEVIDIISSQTSSDYISNIQRILRRGNQQVDSEATPQTYFLDLQRSNRELVFACAGTNVESSCYQRFRSHCSVIKRLHHNAKVSVSQTGSEVMRGLEAEMELHGTLDPRHNMSFDAFNDLMCRRNYTNEAGEASNFFAFRERLCSGTNNVPECSDRRLLLQRFNAEYSFGGTPSDKNIRQGFGAAVARRNFTTITEAQITAFNQITESPRELRARFGGDYPSVSSAGRLIPATPSNNNRTPASASQGETPVSPAETSALPVTPSASSEITSPSQIFQAAASSIRRPVDDFSGVIQRQPTAKESSSLISNPFFRQRAPEVLQPLSAPTPSAMASPTTTNESSNRRDETGPVNIRNAQADGVQTRESSGSTGSVAQSGSRGNASLSTPEIESPRSSRRNGQTNFNRVALLNGKYADVSADPVSQATEDLEARPALPVSVPPEVLRSVINDPSILSSETSIMEVVNSAPDQIVKLELATGDDKTIVYALKEGNAISFSFTPPEQSAGARAPASLGVNELNIRLQSDLYSVVNTNVSILRNYPEIIRAAMELPGDVVKLNIITLGAYPLTIYVDKRNPELRFTVDDPAILKAYRP